ncbi:MAG: histidine--tRNA ligase [Euryarchaeota archaeon]|nr:histidine--tRNA ligase [Euryarchaeota archaeon]
MMFKRPRGTRDFLPDEMEKRRYVEGVIRRVFEGYGYQEVQTPTFEHLELITTKSGEEIKEHLYHFKDKGGRDLALRPELTAPAMRLYISEYQQKPKPRKIFYIGNCFRYERPQSGRYREFWQAGLELIGSSYPEADAEVIAVAVDVLEALGLKDYSLHVGHIGVLRRILDEAGVGEEDQNRVMGAIDKGEGEALEHLLDTLGLGARERELMAGLLEMEGERDTIEKARELLEGREGPLRELDSLEEVVEKLGSFGVTDYVIDLGMARGLDYYTGTVFEIYAPKLGAEKQICGGGAYSLVEVLGGKKAPTCGFAFGFDRLILALEMDKFKFNEVKKDRYLVVSTTEGLLDEAIRISRSLRERRKIPCQIDPMRRRLGKALSYADAEGFSHVVILGEEEYKKGKIIIKELETGRQSLMDIREVEGFES